MLEMRGHATQVRHTPDHVRFAGKRRIPEFGKRAESKENVGDSFLKFRRLQIEAQQCYDAKEVQERNVAAANMCNYKHVGHTAPASASLSQSISKATERGEEQSRHASAQVQNINELNFSRSARSDHVVFGRLKSAFHVYDRRRTARAFTSSANTPNRRQFSDLFSESLDADTHAGGKRKASFDDLQQVKVRKTGYLQSAQIVPNSKVVHPRRSVKHRELSAIAGSRSCRASSVDSYTSTDSSRSSLDKDCVDSRLGFSGQNAAQLMPARRSDGQVVRKRLLANERERQRVQALSEAFHKLRHTIPSYSGAQKLSKLAVLKVAISYIAALTALKEEENPVSRARFSSCVVETTEILQGEIGKTKKC